MGIPAATHPAIPATAGTANPVHGVIASPLTPESDAKQPAEPRYATTMSEQAMPQQHATMPAEYAIYYHDHCADGFTAAWAATTILGPDNCDLHPVRYDADDLPDPYPLPEQKVLILDFSYPRTVMERLIAEQPYVRLFDHHQTALQNLAGLPGCILDMERSGAMITWQTLTQEQTGAPADQVDAPDLIRYVQDRDLWHWQLPDSRAINAYIATMPYQLHEWNLLCPQLADRAYRQFAIQCGWVLLRSQEQVVKAQAEQARMMDIAGLNPGTGMVDFWTVPVANATVHRSETAALLLANHPNAPFAAVYSDTPSGRRWSLRSEMGRADVAHIAEYHGGGGHRNAAGYTSPLPEER